MDFSALISHKHNRVFTINKLFNAIENQALISA